MVDVPKDVQFATGVYHAPRKSDVHVSYAPRMKGDATQIRRAVSLLANAGTFLGATLVAEFFHH